VDGDVVFQPFNKENVVDNDLDVAGAFFDKDIIALARIFVQRIGVLQPLFGFPDGLDEALERDGFLKIVDHIQVIALKGEFGEGRGEDGERPVRQDFEKGQAGHLGHADIEEKQVGGVGLEGFEGMKGIVADGDELEAGELADIELEELAGHGFVFDDMTADRHGRSMLKVTE
jgi:hypothetical protein